MSVIGVVLMVIGGIWCAVRYFQHSVFPDDDDLPEQHPALANQGPPSAAYFLSSFAGPSYSKQLLACRMSDGRHVSVFPFHRLAC